MDWFRLHAKILNDPRVQTLEPMVFKLYINALCHACLVEKDGYLGTLDDVSFAFRETKEAVSSAFHALTERGLIATVGETFHIPQWNVFQRNCDRSLRPSAREWATIRSSIFRRDDFTCSYCGAHGVRLECDHIVPVSRGGSHDSSNLTTACLRCNRAKNDKLLSEWVS